MNDLILQSIIEITRQRDLDSLEYSLVATLGELIPITGASILKSLERDNLASAEEIVRLDITQNGPDKKYTWSNESRIITTDENYKKCLSNEKEISFKHKKGFVRTMYPISNDTQTIGAMLIDSFEDLKEHKSIIEMFLRLYENYMVVLNESERDKLTGLFNRRTFENKLHKLFRTQKNRNRKLLENKDKNERRQYDSNASSWLIITDIDHFKRVNDTFGHVFGDEIILTISQLMKGCFRNSDILFRIGGEEFVILLEPVSQKIADQLIDRFRKTIAEHKFSQIGSVTVSAGYARITEKDYPPEILDCADKALYYAKEHGRNCAYNYIKLVKEEKISSPKKSGAIDLF